ncbi:MAG TPA: CBS domain-containing protein [Actinomycetota bacterium]
MKARDIMSRPAITVTPETPLKRVAELMVDHRIALVPVVDASGNLLGVISEADLLRGNATPQRGEIITSTAREGAAPGTAAMVMTMDVVAAEEAAEVADLFPLMVERHLKGVPVVSDGIVTGVLARRDLLRLLVRTDTDVHDDVMEVLDHVGEEPFSVDVAEGVVTINRWLGPSARRRIEAFVRAIPGVMAVVFKE